MKTFYKNILIISLVFFITNGATAQSYILYGDKTFGTNQKEMYDQIVYAGNNQFILAGSTSGDINGDKTDPVCSGVPVAKDIWIVKIDTSFNISWDKSLGGAETEMVPSLIMTGTNKDMLFGCRSASDSACDKSEHNRAYPSLGGYTDYWVCMLDSNGNKIWDKTLGGIADDGYAHIIRLSNGAYLVCGKSNPGVGGDKTVANYGGGDYWAVKLTSNGQKIWDKVYGGTGNELEDAGYGTDMAILPTEAGGFLIAGTTESPSSGLITDTSRGASDIWVIKCDSAGTKIWDRRFGGNDYDFGNDIIHTPDGGYMVCGSTQSQQGLDLSQISRGFGDVWLIKLDASGNKQWEKRYGGNKYDIGTSVQNAPGGGYWVSGYSNSDSSYEVTEPGYAGGGGGDYWMLKIDSIGNKIWDKRFGGPGANSGCNFVIMPDSSIYLLGTADSGTTAVKKDAGHGDWDYWLVHFKYTDSVTVGVNELSASLGQLSIMPNPAKDICTITCAVSNAMLTLYDITGRELLRQAFNTKATLDVSALARGVYIAEVKDKEGRSAKGKVVKE